MPEKETKRQIILNQLLVIKGKTRIMMERLLRETGYQRIAHSAFIMSSGPRDYKIPEIL